MTRDEALVYIREHSRDYATETWGRDRSGKGWICPLCGSGSGDKGTGITTKDGVHFTCWAGCFTNADVVDVIALVEHIPETDHTAKFEAARREFGIVELDGPPAWPRRTKAKEEFKDLDAAEQLVPSMEGNEGAEGNLESFFLEANRHLSETDYHRGISLKTLNRFRVGYVAVWRHPKAPNAPETPRLIIPTGPASYIARDTRPDIPQNQEAYKKQQVGSRGRTVFNGAALMSAKEPIFITEGELDALSIIDVGGEAVTAGSAARWAIVAEALKANPPACPVIVAFDDDEVGRESGAKLKRALAEAGVAFIDYKPPMGAKDANAALMADRAAFAASVQAAIAQAKMTPEERREEARQEYISRASASASLQGLVDRIRIGEKDPPFPTGFFTLDKVLNGGLRPGLYVLGGLQSIGKTGFCMQMMDNIAAAGNDVLVFSLEMSRQELIARSVSRITYELSLMAGTPGKPAYSAVEILSGSAFDKDGAEGRQRIMDAVLAYSRYSDRVFIVEGTGDVSVAQMRSAVESHIELTGRRPVVCVDYLQIVPGDGKSRTDKQVVDYNVVALKRLSRDLSVPVVVVSSLNRQGYAEPLNPSGFKESGSVEYSADALIGLQFQGMDYRLGDEKEGQRARRVAALIAKMNRRGEEGKPQGIHLKVLKNRGGYKKGIYLSYHPAFNHFEVNSYADEQEERADEEWARSVEREVKGRGGRLY